MEIIRRVSTQPVFRFAPSPNGWLHLGHALSALLNADLANALGGRLLLRIEDIDPLRSRPEFEAGIYEDLAWLGLRWEEPVLRQSAEFGRYAAALDGLKSRRLVYPCFCTRAGLRRIVAERGTAWPVDPDGTPHYAGQCRDIEPAEAARRIASGEPHAWRLSMDRALREAGDRVSWRSWDPAAGSIALVDARPGAWGDVVLGRKDVPTSYHLSVVLDDALQGVSHVVRGADLFASTDVHALLQRLLGLQSPLYHHHRLLLDEDGAKLAKSANAKPLRQWRAGGKTPDWVRRQVGLGQAPVGPVRTPVGPDDANGRPAPRARTSS